MSDPSAPAGSGRPGLAGGWRRMGLSTILAFEAIVLVSAGIAYVVLRLEGASPLSPRLVGPSPAFEDALWHLGTTVLLALAVRNHRSLWVAPLLSLGLDLDHLPAAFGLATIPRPDHSFVFLIAMGLLLYRGFGRASAGTAVGAVLSHIGLDGASFPLFSPISSSLYSLSLLDQGLFVLFGGLALFLAVRPAREFLQPHRIAPLLVSVGLLCLLLVFVWPALGIFTRN